MDPLRRSALAATLAALTVSLAPAQATGPAQKRDLSKGNTLFVVPYAHLDTQWRWSYPQVIREFIWNTMDDNLKLIDKYPHYVFNFSGSRRYEMMREYYPAEYAKVVAAVKAGRWFPAGSSVDEGDANVPSSESLIRHVLYGNDWFRNNLGVASEEFMLPDCFGFPYALPTVLAHCGIKGFSTQKLTWGSPIGIPFKVGTWEGPDGQSIVAALDPGAYTGEVREDLSQNTSWLARIQNTGKISGAYTDYHYYGTGDRGGAPGENSVEWIEKSIAGTGPVNVVSTRSDAMFESLSGGQIAKLPHYKGELLLTEHSAGSITSEAHMKRWNRKNELLADAAERASVAASLWTQTAYPTDRLYRSWDLLLGSQMHDMLPGTSLPKAYEYCWNDELLAANGFESIERDAVGAVTAQMNTQAAGVPLVVYNPLSIAREDVVEASIAAPRNRIVEVYGPDGKYVPTQQVGYENGQVKILFLAKVPSSGFATYDARVLTQTMAKPSTLSVKGSTLESPRFRVRINEAGDIASIYDKVNKREALKAPTSLDFQHHNPSQFPAWNMDWDDAKLPPYAKVDGPAKIRVIENGPVRVTLEIERESHGSKFVQRVRLAAGGAGDRVEVENLIDWNTRESALKAAFPVTTANPTATYDLQVGAIQRTNNNPGRYEVPQHQWFDVTAPDNKYGVAILNDSKFGSDKPSDDTVRLTLLYTPGVRGGYQDQATQDVGRHRILYAIAPHAGDWRKGDVAWEAKRLNQPLRAFVVPAHEGRLGRTDSLATTSSRGVEIQAIKRAENGDGTIVRLRELTGSPAKNVLVGFSNSVVSAQEVDGQERPLGPATVKNGKVVADVRGFGLKAYRVRFATTRILLPQPVSQAVPLKYDLDVASTDANDRDGAFDSEGRSYSADLLPKTLNVNGVRFVFGSTVAGAKNALAARGQTIALPKGFDRVVVLAAATQDATGTFKVGSKSQTVSVPAWDGYIGQWDNRLWAGVVPELTYNWNNPMVGLVPGYVKKAEVAWYGSHRHIPGKGNDYYAYTYLFKQTLDVPKGATSLTLPNDPNIRIFAVSVARQTHDDAKPAAPLFDTLEDHKAGGAPTIDVTPGEYGNGVNVTLRPPLYWSGAGLRYTTDGSIPTASSPVYTEPLFLYKPTTIKAAQFDANGKPGPLGTFQVDAHDSVRPTITGISAIPSLNVVIVKFSERLDPASAQDPTQYGFRSQIPVKSATLQPDGRTVLLTLDPSKPLADDETMGTAYVKDLAGNPTDFVHIGVAKGAPVWSSPELAPSKTATFQAPVPTDASAPWTLNLWVKPNAMPEDRTLIAGFGRAVDGREGTGRYFAKFPNGIHFWITSQDVTTNTPYDIGQWQMLTAVYDGKTVHVYKNGKEIGAGEVTLANDAARVNVMPPDAWDRKRMLDGEVAGMTVWNVALPGVAVDRLYAQGRG